VKKDFLTKFSWRYWVPVIMLYHGMRVEEVCQLLLKNICKIDNVWCFHIRDERDENERILTTTKIRGENTGERFVPIHPKVIDIGLLKYVEYLKRCGVNKLFPSLSNISKKGEYKSSSNSVSKWFNEDSPKQSKVSYFTTVGIEKEKRNLVLYSFKHTVETFLINHPDKIEHDKIDTVIGHTVQSMGRKHYGKYSKKTLLDDVVKQIDYLGAGLPWDVNEKYQDIKFPWG
jgi:integrase